MTPERDDTLPDAAAAAAIHSDGWRLLLGRACSTVAVGSLPAAVEVAAAAVRVCGDDAAHLRLDLRADRVDLVLRTPADGRPDRPDATTARITPVDDRLSRLEARLAARISTAVGELGLATTPGAAGAARPVQALEIAIDALDIPAVLPFWRAVLGYVVDTRQLAEGHEVIVVDPAEQGPTVWFQQLDTPRPHRNRIHFDLTVAEDEAEVRIAAALASGGRLVSDAQARAFWILADPEGNEVCICTWQDRD
jgi:4a-hydroxytetrahydrobiopterin dehydratase